MGHFSRACKSRASHQKPHQQSNFVESEPSEEAFAIDGEKTARSDKRPGRKFFAHLHLIHGGKTNVVRAQIDTASTCNTMPESLLRKLFLLQVEREGLGPAPGYILLWDRKPTRWRK